MGLAPTLAGTMHFRGAIADGTSALAFTLPSAYRPAGNVYVPVDLCNIHKGRLLIEPTGAVSVQTEGTFSDAQCFTSLGLGRRPRLGYGAIRALLAALEREPGREFAPR